MKESKNLIKLLSEAIDSGRGAAFVTVISVAGSTPREAGAKMLVYADGSIEGTVGGGAVESLVIKKAVECVAKGEGGKFVFGLKPGGNTGMICMGDMEVFIDVYKNPFRVLILGGGHVGVKIAEACRLAGYPYLVADDRKEFANPERFPEALAIINEKPHEAVAAAGADADTYAVIVTRGHLADLESLRAVLGKPWRYAGMIGSRKKVRLMLEQALADGFDPAWVAAVCAPIGLDIGAETPEELAIAIVGELVAVRRGLSDAGISGRARRSAS